MNALSDLTGFTIMYSIPSLGIDMINALLDFFFIHMAQESEDIILIKTNLKVQDRDLKGMLLFFLPWDSLRKLAEKLKIE